MAKTGKIVEVLFENALETYEHQMQMLSLVDRFEPDAGDMQNTSVGGQNTGKFGGGVIWRPVQQHAPIEEGWDMTGKETDIVEETYPAILTPPKNDIFKQTADDMRDMQFWERRGVQSGKKQATNLNKVIANAIGLQGSLYYETNETNGYGAVGEGQTMLNERQSLQDDDRFCILNDRDTLKYAKDLAGRQTVQGRPETAWATGQIGQNVAEFDVYTGSFTGNQVVAGAITGAGIASLSGAPVSTSGDSFIPAGGSVDAVTGAVTNVDYRVGVLTLANATGVVVGGKYTIAGLNAVGKADKTDTGQLMTFTCIAVSGNDVTVYPKPITDGLVDTNQQSLYRAYANCTGTIVGADLTPLSTNGGKVNLFGARGAVEVTSGDAPIQLLNEFGGMKVISSTMSNGQKMYMAYDGDILKMDFTCRLFTWYGVTIKDPQACGSWVSF